jgi:hypothetical protein
VSETKPIANKRFLIFIEPPVSNTKPRFRMLRLG